MSGSPGAAEALGRAATVAAVLSLQGARAAWAAARDRSWRSAAPPLREALERLGPAFVKLGQFLSVRPDLLPPPLIQELERLQDRTLPLPVEAVLDVLEEELGEPAGRLFPVFDPEPVASASLSQVHRAELPDGTAVAVKVQRPGAARVLRRDLHLVGRLAQTLARLSPLRRQVDPSALWEEVLAAAESELDFRREAEAAEAMGRRFRGFPGIRVPRVYWAFTARRVLTLEFVEGVKISHAVARGRADYAELAERGARAFLKQVFEDGVFHADLHPANLLITPAGEIAYLDFGIVGRLSPEDQKSVLGALAGLLGRDAPLALRHLARLGVEVRPDRAGAFAADVEEVMRAALAPRLADVAVGRIGWGLMAAVRRHGVRFPRRHALLIKALLTVEGTARLLHPGFSFEESARVFVSRETRRFLSPSVLLEAGWRAAALLGWAALTPAARERIT